jgi:hypothetical protein
VFPRTVDAAQGLYYLAVATLLTAARTDIVMPDMLNGKVSSPAAGHPRRTE